ncbi:MAG: tRNA 2-selenouridine(34) synthase MnmH [Halieaceae bacterium]|nr:tRNA 2-selenouridine(34) synthase MnmH [Halieaceae bacterium]
MDEIDDLASLFLRDIPLIDTRAPVEFNKGSLPLAINLPLMIDAEREAVGICYQQQGQAAAIRLGHELVNGELKADRLNQWIRFTQQHPDGALFCFRGGLRSEITQNWLKEQGIRYPRIRGGYKAMRRWLIEAVEKTCANTPLLLLGGKTGSAKTRVLNEGFMGNPITGSIDLEGLANHRGSAFGKRVTAQPTQISFELAVGIEMAKRYAEDPSRLILEDEGRLIGRCALPLPLQAARHHADWIQLEVPLEDRVQHSYDNYILSNLEEMLTPSADWDTAFNEFERGLLDALSRIQKRLGDTRYRALHAELTAALSSHRLGDPEPHKKWIEVLLTQYYDPMYNYQMAKRVQAPIFRGNESEVIGYLTA